MELKPDILCHPNIPKPLHGIAPRSIMGDDWWNEERQKVYQSTDYHCIACGVHKTEAKKHQWLEAHEFFDIDYSTGICKIKSIEPLCHYCHNFIHSGRLSMIIGKEKTEDEVIEILEHGFSILSKNKLKSFPFTLQLAEEIGAKTYGVKPYKIKLKNIQWSDWVLIWQDKKYRSRYDSYEDWQKHYQNNQ